MARIKTSVKSASPAVKLVRLEDGTDKRADERRDFAAERGAFWLEQSTDEEGMHGRVEFTRADFVLIVERGETQSGAFESGAVDRIGSVVAAVTLLGSFPAIDLGEATARRESERTGLLDQRAAQSRDHQNVRGGIRFRVVGRREAGDVAREFDDSVLEATARA